MLERREQGKLGRPDWDGSVQVGRGLRAGLGIFLARHGQLHSFTIFIVLNFERGEKLGTALLSISILCLLENDSS